ncbi:adenine phosphoribosyltransferase [Mesohalobacter halotolerans]|jgi:adenine phosphoribosyltransferase|uniref:Adenine phosphoribosyltransferase n=1 Tax=Mesohalobacter halotolerans TaxID=1883405 RepID=A0A4U5TNK6_9FLAO|nr:adenine phosphoribosyltransferase [Mesohalobacter halotolerans]MBS3738336.1 adenine phosphoribosyltransferase [Psychroflexus sp.]NBC58825.1 adenine phosphoribosyltransferase [Bacteroidota bacterium]TKS55609.1 adenine phosphoribosyltransferase [Mesohalobacter halotolerans]
MDFKQYIREVPNFPKPGVSYKDITPLLLEPRIVNLCVEAICDNIPPQKQIHKVVGIESRGFLLSTLIAQKLNAGVVLVRKPGKLPYKTHTKSYSLEYGEDAIEMHVDAVKKGENVLIHDDVLATGGTAKATNELVEMCGGLVVQNNFLIELESLQGRGQLLNQEIYSLMMY